MLSMREPAVFIVTLGKSETYKETIKEKSTILPYSIHLLYRTASLLACEPASLRACCTGIVPRVSICCIVPSQSVSHYTHPIHFIDGVHVTGLCT